MELTPTQVGLLCCLGLPSESFSKSLVMEVLHFHVMPNTCCYCLSEGHSRSQQTQVESAAAWGRKGEFSQLETKMEPQSSHCHFSVCISGHVGLVMTKNFQVEF